ncbi:membrane protein [Gammaproteobacteria bacterium MFB021]|nr:membrane protein [Gammaproteobacteria bacterium MFB021]
MPPLDATTLAAQLGGLIALGFIILAFASRQDDRLLLHLIFANVAFAVHFLLFGEWTAAGITLLVIVRILLARRYRGDWRVMLGMLALNLAVALAVARGPADLWPLVATLFGTVGMFMLRGIPMRLCLAAAALAWLINNALIGSLGGIVAELLALVTNLVTIWRLRRWGIRPSD